MNQIRLDPQDNLPPPPPPTPRTRRQQNTLSPQDKKVPAAPLRIILEQPLCQDHGVRSVTHSISDDFADANSLLERQDGCLLQRTF